MPESYPLERVLSCPTLPTLPGVAMQVLELTRDPNVTIVKLAKLVQSDPSLSAKILRTVNSSFFGLSQPCSKIDRALSLLGLNTIKSLVLGFTLVEGTRGVDGESGLDLTAHWRRAVYSASAARHIALESKRCDPDEAFTGAMLQDIGMMAAIVAMPDRYGPLLTSHGAEHDSLPAVERERFGFDHAEVGAALAKNWHLPELYVAAIAYHHHPADAPAEVRPLAEVVWLGMLVAEAMSATGKGSTDARFLMTASQWLKVEPDKLGPVLKKIADGAAELAKAFEREVGARPNISAIMAQASEQMINAQISAQTQADQLSRANQDLTKQATTDALTGAFNRNALDSEFPALFVRAMSSGESLGVLFMDADKFKSVNDAHGHPAGDAVLIELSNRARAAVDSATGGKGRVYRYGGEEFVAVLPRAGKERAAQIAEQVRSAVEAEAFDLSRVPGAAPSIRVTASIGYAWSEPGTSGAPISPEALLKLADEGVYQAKQAGRNCVRTVQGVQPVVAGTIPAVATGSTPSGPTVLLVEDDALSARLIQAALTKAGAGTVLWAARADEACRQLSSSSAIGVVVCDYHLGDRTALDVIGTVRATPSRLSVPVVVVTCSEDSRVREESLNAGAAAFWTKGEMCADLAGWCKRILSELSARRAA
ncbi:MAG: HDOD domain-containing protein, partial [Planctomycetota bacterium]